MTTAMSSLTTLFDHYRKSLEIAGIPAVYGDSLICPLCWKETRLDDLSIEHVVPSSIGGMATVLTCRRCNNDHGSSLDAHLAQYQTMADAFQGHGMIPTELNINGKRLVANLEWGDTSKNFHVVGKASDLRQQDLVKADFQSGKVQEVNFTIDFGYSKNRFQTALLRAAYLILFRRLGYEYVQHEIVQILRRRICEPSLEFPRLGSFTMELRNCNLPADEQHLIANGNVNGVRFFLVLVRVQKRTITHLAVFMPFPEEDSKQYFDLMERCSREYNGHSFTIPLSGLMT
jgi:hypothetical protein